MVACIARGGVTVLAAGGNIRTGGSHFNGGAGGGPSAPLSFSASGFPTKPAQPLILDYRLSSRFTADIPYPDAVTHNDQWTE